MTHATFVKCSVLQKTFIYFFILVRNHKFLCWSKFIYLFVMVHCIRRASSPIRCVGINHWGLTLPSKCNRSFHFWRSGQGEICIFVSKMILKKYKKNKIKKTYPKLLHTSGKLVPKLGVGTHKFGVGVHRYRVRHSFV